MLLAVRISSYGCTWEVWRALKKLELPSAAPRATLTYFSCSPNFPRASITPYTHAKHEQIHNLPPSFFCFYLTLTLCEINYWTDHGNLLISLLIQPVTVTLVLPFITFNLFSYFFSCILKHTRVSYDFACKNAHIHSNARQMLRDARQTLLLRLFFISGIFGVEFVTRAEEWYKPVKIKSVESEK